MAGTVEQTCAALGRYYASLGKEYKELFSDYCDDNGLDEDTMEEELQQAPSDCLLVDFDENFPFKNEPKNKAQFIFDLIRRCRDNPKITFEVPLPEFDQNLFDIKNEDLAEIKKLYQTQCPVLWNSGMSTDGGFLQILAVARKFSFDYLQHLVDDYSRDRVKHIDEGTGWTEKMWSRNHKHFQRLRNVTVKVPKEAHGVKPKTIITKVPYNELATGAVISFGKRCTPKLLFSNMMFIKESLEVTAQFLYAAINFISNLVQSPRTICPFQVDMAIAVGAPRVNEDSVSYGDDDDDDDEVDEDDLKKDFVDCIGNVKNKLKKNGLRHILSEVDLTKEARIFRKMYSDFVTKHKLDQEEKDEKTEYLHKKRLITFIDRRNVNLKVDDEKAEDEKSKIYMYEPPKNCQNIPDDPVPEWGISSSRTCLLPDMDYGDGSDAITGPDTSNQKDNKDEKEDNAKKLKDSNIGASFHCKGGLITFSFHVKAIDVIKCYMYWNGTIIRFMPEDIKTVLPKMFDMGYADNQAYIDDNKDLEGMIQEMQEKLVDKEFKAFQESYA